MGKVIQYYNSSENILDDLFEKPLFHRLATLLRFFDFLEIRASAIFGVALLSFSANALAALGYALLIPFISVLLSGNAGLASEAGILVSISNYLTWIGDSATARAMLVGGIIALLWCARSMLEYYAGLWSVMQARTLDYNLKIALFSRFLIYGKGYFDSRSLVFLNVVLNGFTSNVARLTLSLQRFFSAACAIVFFGAILMFISWKLTLLVALVFPLAFYVPLRLTQKLRLVSEDALERYQQLRSDSINSLGALYLTKNFDKEAEEQTAFAESLNDNLESQYEETRVKSLIESVNSISGLLLLLITAAFLPIATDVSSGQDTVAELLVFFIILRRLSNSVDSLSSLDIALSTCAAQLRSISRQLFDQHKYHIPEGEMPLPPIKKGIHIKNLGFSYGSTRALDSLTMFIPAGAQVAIIGRNGSGKSTIAELLLRHYEIADGTIFIDDKDIKNFSLASIRQRITLIPQKAHLVAGTIRDNILYGAAEPEQISDTAISAVLKRCGMTKLITEREDGLDTLIGPNGEGFSAGERQLISVTRGFFRQADVYILDEVGTSLDEFSRLDIKKAIGELTKNKTCVTITHRLSDLSHLDTIFFLKDGHVAEMGTMSELLARESEFRKTWQQQASSWRAPKHQVS